MSPLNNNTLSEMIQKIVEEMILQEKTHYRVKPLIPVSELPPPLPKKPRKLLVKPKPRVKQSDLEYQHKEFLVATLRGLGRNVTAYKILNGLPLHRKEVLAFAKQLIDTGTVPAKNFKHLAKMLATLSFDIADEQH